MIIKIKQVEVGTSVVVGRVRRTFTAEMTDLIGKYVEVTRLKDGWLAMREEYSGNKFAFHATWCVIDRRKDSVKPLQLPINTPVEIRTRGGVLGLDGLQALILAVATFDRYDGDTNTKISWPNFSNLVDQSQDWLIWSVGGKSLDQRYRQYTLSKYGVQVPDAICETIAKTTKRYMSTQKTETVRFVDDEMQRIDGNSGQIMHKGTIISYRGWLFIPGDGVPLLEVAHAVCWILGKEKYTCTTVRVEGLVNVLCVHKIGERGPLTTTVYHKEAK